MVTKGKISFKISRQELYIGLIVLSFVTSAYLNRITFFNLAYNILRYFFSFVAILVFAKERKRNYKWLLLLGLFYLAFIWSSIINQEPIMSLLKNALFSISFCVLMDFYLKKDLITTISSVRKSLEILMWINLVTVILFPDGLYIVTSELHATAMNPAYFLGHRNNAIEVFIPLVGLAMLESHMLQKRMDTVVIRTILCSLVTVVLTWSANAILCVALFIVYCFLYKRPHYKLYNVWTFFFSSVVATIGLVVLRIERMFYWLITGILHKSITLSTRTLIWERSVNWIKKSPIYGYGVESAEVKFPKIRALNSCHNYYLDYLYYGGVIMLIIVLLLFYVSVKNLGQIKDNKIIDIIATTFGSYFILWIATPIHRGSIVWMFVFWLISYVISNDNQLCKSNGREI